MSIPERPSERQQLNFLADGSSEIDLRPSLADSHPNLTRYLDFQRLWGGHFLTVSLRKDRTGILTNLATDQSVVFDPNNWQVLDEQPTTDPALPKKLSGAILIAPAGAVNLINETVNQWHDPLCQLSPLYVFEMKDGQTFDPEALETRRQLMIEAGYAAAKILPRSDPTIGAEYLVWRGRVEKKRPAMNIDLLRPGQPEWKIQQYRKMYAAAAAAYRRQGFKITDSTEIVEAMHHSPNPPQTISSLKLGFGVTVQSLDCECRWEISLKGVATQVYKCALDCTTTFEPW